MCLGEPQKGSPVGRQGRGAGWHCAPQKADEAVLEPRAKQDELQCAMAQLSEMMQDLLQRMSLHGQARRKALDPVSEVDSKVEMSPGGWW